MPVTLIESRWRFGFQEFYDVRRNHVVAVNAPVKIMDDFNGLEVDGTNDWNEAGVNGGAATANNGWATLTTGGANDDDIDLASELIFNGTNFCVMEARLRNDDVANSAVAVGFADATGYAADLIAVSDDADTLTTTAADAAVFFHDTDSATDTWRAVCVDTGTDGTEIDTLVTPVNAQIQNFRIAIDDSGYAYFWFSTGTTALSYIGADTTVGVTPGTSLCAYVGYITREIGANTLDIDFIRAWGGRID